MKQHSEKITMDFGGSATLGKTPWNDSTEKVLGKATDKLRKERVDLFVKTLGLGPDDIVLDLGSEDGSYLGQYYPYPENIVLADIFEEPMKRGVLKYGLKGYQLIPIDGPLPFEDQSFDAVWCNSAIEHVTVPRSELRSISSAEFKRRAEKHQKVFAKEIARVGKRYFVQTPYLHFVLEAHSWLPLVHYFSHVTRYRLSKWTKRFWVKQWSADFMAYSKRRFKAHFPTATGLLDEKVAGMTKSIIAYKK